MRTLGSEPGRKLVSNLAFWNAPQSVLSQQPARPFLYWYEERLLQYADRIFRVDRRDVQMVHIVGCGPGREIPLIRAVYPNARIVASDIAPAMIQACAHNLDTWNARAGVELRCCAASALGTADPSADLVVMLNNVLTYVTPHSERTATLRAVRDVMRAGALSIGVVHHRWGRPGKSAYFALLALLGSAVGVADPGRRVARMGGMRRELHYFTRRELRTHLHANRLYPVEIASLRRLAKVAGITYRALTGDNNLVFLARAD